jgi:A/G-specific adenine glycosylase
LSIRNRKSLITRSILRWFARSARKLPWRGEENPYRILVSEIMLQQTQVSRVLQKYPLFIRRFPSFSSLAVAKTSSVIREWKGMGYNNRAIRLQRLARIVKSQYRGMLPKSVEELQSLPGIGKYTAHALSYLVHGQNVPVVDTNIKRVLSRLFRRDEKNLGIWETAQSILPSRKAHIWNQALMDLGALICTAANPKCGICPVAGYCPS